MTVDQLTTSEELVAKQPHTLGIPHGYKWTEIGVIPEEWDTCDIGALNPFVTSGSRGWAKYYSDRGSAFVRITNLSRETIYLDLSDLKLVNLPPDTSEGTRTQLKNGDILISITADIGIIGYVYDSLQIPAYINQHIALVRFDPSKADSLFVSYFLASKNAQRRFQDTTDTGAKAGMNLDAIRKIRLVLPPLSEQRAIAAALSDVDALIATLDSIIAKKHDIKTATLQQLLTGKQRLPGFGGEWKLKRLGDIFDKVIGGGTPSRSNPKYWGHDIPWATVKDLTKFHPSETQESITREGLKNSASCLIPKGILIISTRMALGKAVIFNIDVAINQDLKALFLKQNTVAKFLYYWFEYNAPLIEDIGSGSTVKGISLMDLKKLEFHLAPLEEQIAIAAVLSDMDEEIAALDARREKTQGIKLGMMQTLLTGKIRIINSSHLAPAGM
jgi:type I restriction enzyme, S subunit